MNKVVTKILKQLAKEAVKHPEVRRQAEQLAALASRKAIEVAEGTAQWLRERRSKMEASDAESRRAPARKKTARKSVAGKSAAKKTSAAKRKGKR